MIEKKLDYLNIIRYYRVGNYWYIVIAIRICDPGAQNQS